MTEEPSANPGWQPRDALAATLVVLGLTLIERAWLATPLARSLTGAALLGLRVATVAVFYAVVAGAMVLLASRTGTRPVQALALNQPLVGRQAWDAVRLAFVGVAFDVAFLTLAQRVGLRLGPTRDIVQFFGLSPGGLVALVFVGVVVGPLVEEMAFRGVVLPALVPRWGERGAIWASAVLFGAVHLSTAAFVPIAVLGAMLGWLRVRYRSLWPSVLGHGTFNAIVLLLTVLLRAQV